MSLLKMACDTYDYAEEQYAGVYKEGQKEPLAPIAHTITNAGIEITIDRDGKFVSANEVASDESKTIFPVTENSQGRTRAPEPHPLCDKMQYLNPLESDKNAMYVEQLEMWMNSKYTHPFVRAIYNYVRGATINDDIKSAEIKKCDGKSFVRWRVVGVDGENEACWKNRVLQNNFIEYYLSKENKDNGICMISGEKENFALKHARGIVSINEKAKLISSDDTTNFTYKGRFVEAWEALTIGYKTSQKAHNALRWLIANQSVVYGGRSFVCWNPEGENTPKLVDCMIPYGMAFTDVPKKYIPSDYQKWTQDVLGGWKSRLEEVKNIVTAVFDAATTGRLAVVYYSEMSTNDFLNRISYWDKTCCSINGMWGIQSPSLYDIVKFAVGTYRKNDFEVDDKLLKHEMLRLLKCRLEKVPVPVDIEQSVVKNAANLQLYDKSIRNRLLFTTCAVIRKYKLDNKKEEWAVALEPEKKDRSYQYGRLLATLEKEERDSYSENEERETNAMRMQSVFVNRPQYATRILIEQIKRAYERRLRPGAQIFYERLIGEIMEQLSSFGDELNKPLDDTYLLGYYMQKNEFYNKSKENK